MTDSAGLRLGITGHRWTKISSKNSAKLADRLRVLFDPISALHCKVTLVCGMAEGTDLIAAAAAPEDWALEAVLGLPHALWHQHLRSNPDGAPGDAATYLRLIQDAKIISVQSTQTSPDYVWVAKHIATNCDRLIAVWDGKPGGKGGTADVIAMARERGIDVTIVPSDF